MKTLYDVQQFLKSFGIIIYMGKRLYDIEMMKINMMKIYLPKASYNICEDIMSYLDSI